jgi:hypothetical protein
MSVSLDTDAKSNLQRPRQVHSRKGEKKKYLGRAPRATSYFHPFVVSTDGSLARKEDLAEEAIHRLAEKWEVVAWKCVYVNAL